MSYSCNRCGHVQYDSAQCDNCEWGDLYPVKLAQAVLGPTTEEIWKALEESVKLQSHYAELLNMHDGGQRRTFKTPQEWIARLRETKSAKAPVHEIFVVERDNTYYVEFADGTSIECVNEDSACAIQRVWRKSHGQDPMIGNPKESG